MKKIAWLGLVFVASVLAACSSSKKVTAPPLSDRGVTEEYRIGVGDSLQVSVWRNPELSTGVPVRPDGKISLPLIGDIMAANLTATQLSKNIIAGLESYVRNPQVTVIVANPSSSDFQRRVRITGAVGSPQSLPYRDGMQMISGTVAVVVPVCRRSEVNAWLASWPEFAEDARGARAAVDSSVAPSGEDRIVVLTGLDTKGLEFDGIVVVRPQEIEAESATGRATLYVVYTRATQLLTTIS